MVTTRRTNNDLVYNTDYNDVSNVTLLERTVASYDEADNTVTVQNETIDQTRSRMQENLEKILNYDRYSATASTIEIEKEDAQEDVSTVVDQEISEMNDDDIRPTSTTMQFGDTNLDEMYKEMNRGKSDEQSSYKLNLKGKIIVAAYAIFVGVIFALIILNTGVLTVLAQSNKEMANRLYELQEEKMVIEEKINQIDDEFVKNIAINDYNMEGIIS